jgi:hypothetical protein
MLHVWYIYLQNWVIFRANVWEYSIRGAYGIVQLICTLHNPVDMAHGSPSVAVSKSYSIIDMGARPATRSPLARLICGLIEIFLHILNI